MIFKEFINKYLNQYLEVVDATNKNQCFDLAIGYCVEVLELPTSIFSGLMYAYQIYTNPTTLEKEKFDIIANSPTGVPKVGDIVIFSNKYGSAGHVVVATGVGDTKTFQAFSQNDPTGSKCVLKTYNYDYVLGWLHFKNWTEINNSDNTMNENITRKSSFFDKVWQAFKGTGSNTDLVDEVTLVDFIDWLGSNINRASNYDKVCNYLEFTNSKTTSFEDIQRVIAGYKSRITDLTNQLNPLASEIKNKEEQVSRLKTQVTEIEKLNSELTKKLTEALNSLPGMQKVYEDRITVLQGQIDTLAKEKGESIATIQTLKTKVDDLIKNQTSVLTIKDLILLIIGKIKK